MAKGKKSKKAKKKPTAKRSAAKRSAAKRSGSPAKARHKARHQTASVVSSAPKKGKMPEALKRYWAKKRASAPRAQPRGQGCRRTGEMPPGLKRYWAKKGRKTNPSIPEPLMNAAKAVGGGFLAAAATLAGGMLLQKLPPMTKIPSVATQVGVGVVAGAALGAAGMPAAGVLVAAGFGTAALQTARIPALSGDTGVSGLLERENKIRGLVEGQRFNSYEQAERAQIKGLVDFVGR